MIPLNFLQSRQNFSKVLFVFKEFCIFYNASFPMKILKIHMFYFAAICSSLQSSSEESPLRFYKKKNCIFAFLKNLEQFYMSFTAILKLKSVIVFKKF